MGSHTRAGACFITFADCFCGVCVCVWQTTLSWGVMDEMVLSLTSAQRPAQDSPIYPALHRGLRGLFLARRFIYSLPPYLALWPSVFQQSAWRPFIPCLSPSVFISPPFLQDLSALVWLSSSLTWWCRLRKEIFNVIWQMLNFCFDWSQWDGMR